MPANTGSPSQASRVLAIDIGSSSVRALLYDHQGTQLEDYEVQLSYRQAVTADGGSESDAAKLLELTIACIDGVLAKAGATTGTIEAVGFTCFWHGLLGLDASGSPSTPVYMWSDKRSGTDASELAHELGLDVVHRATGCRPHSSYWPAKLRWLKRTRPDQYDASRHWVSITDYIIRELTGTLATSISMASGTGFLNVASLEWDAPMVRALDVSLDQLPPIVDRTDRADPLTSDYASRWPALATIPWYPAIGDGAAANVGSGCVGPARVALTIGTSAAMRLILPGDQATSGVSNRLWRYRLDRNQAVVGGALSNGGNAAAWVADHTTDGDLNKLSEEASQVAPDAHGLTILPLFAGERSPSWNEHSTGTIHGLRLSSTAADLFRATLEATAYRLADIYDDLAPLTSSPHEIHANGAAALGSPLWLRIIASTLGHPIDAVDAETEASARGAAICALEAIGAIDELQDAARPVASSYEPDLRAHAAYTSARARQAALEAAINAIATKEFPGT
jgi:gluconokinase